MTDPRAVMRRFGIRPRKSLGQHFLVDRSYLAAIIEAAEVMPDDLVLEIGPGLGVLTEALAARVGRVVAVELDPEMRRVLADVLAPCTNVDLVAADILDVAPGDLLEGLDPTEAGRPYKVVANLPYNITSAVLRHLLEARHPPVRAVVMVQREVAERILAEPGDMSILAVAVQFYATASSVTDVPAQAFYPRPKVQSRVLRLDVRPEPAVPVADPAAFFRTVRAGFGQKRKQLKNSLAAGLDIGTAEAVVALEAAGIDPTRRAQTLDLTEWARLTAALDARTVTGRSGAD